MTRLQRLLSYLHRGFTKAPLSTLALRLTYNGGMVWTVAGGYLTTVVAGGTGGPLAIDLSTMTIAGLVSYLQQQPGYSVPYAVDPSYSGLIALALVDGTGNPIDSNGDHLFAYTSLLYSVMAAYGAELDLAEAAIAAMPAEMSIPTANGPWLDFLGGYYNVPRLSGEADQAYAIRIIVETLMARGNNVAIEAAIARYTGQRVTVSDVVTYTSPTPNFGGGTLFDGSQKFNAVARPQYCLFDVEVGFDLLNGVDQTAFSAVISGLVDRFRDAGTHMRSLSLSGSALSDAHTTVPTDSDDSLVITTANLFGGSFRFDGSRVFSGSVVTVEGLAG